MKKLFLTICLLIFASAVFAQKQYGYVKTRGRIDANGNLIKGKPVKVKTIISIEGKTTVGSDEHGNFSFYVNNNTYVLKKIQNKDYELCDQDLLDKTNHYSADKLIIVMDKPQNIKEDRLRAEKKYRQNAERQLKEKIAELEKCKKEWKISEQEYQKRLQELYSDQNTERSISEMAKRYAAIDFDQLDELNRRIEVAKLNGDFQIADSLLNTKGSMDERSKELDYYDVVIKADEQDLAKRMENHQKSKALKEKLLNDFATDCYSHFEICLQKHNNDSAAYWLELRASKAPNNVYWNLQTGLFILEYMADYDKALGYFELAQRAAISQYGDTSKELAICYNNKGIVYKNRNEFPKAIEYYQKAFSIRQRILPADHPDIANSYNNIGDIFHFQNKCEQALDYFIKALKINTDHLGYFNDNVATNYNNIGGVYNTMRDYDNAINNYKKALDIRLKLYGNMNAKVANIYNNIGLSYMLKSDSVNAITYFNKALDISRVVLGDFHPQTANVYNNIGLFYFNQSNYNEALVYFQKAISDSIATIFKNDIEKADRLNSIGATLHYLQRYDEALVYYQKALSIRLEKLGENHPDVAKSYSNVGWIYNSPNTYPKALEYFRKALNIRLKLYGENHRDVQSLRQIIRDIEIKMNDRL